MCYFVHMSAFKMGSKNLFVFTALLLAWKVYGQTARVEYISQPCTTTVPTTVQPNSQLVVPALCTPVISPCDSCIQECVPIMPCYNGYNGYSNYAPSYPQPMPPIIMLDDADDNWHQILYFLLFAMRNKRNCGSGNFGGNSGGYKGGCGCGGGYKCGCGGCGNNGGCNGGGNRGGGYDHNNLGSNYYYIPYPIPYPMYGPYPYSFPGGYPDNSCCCTEETYQPGQGPTDINLYIRTDSSCCC